jgi:hypothetical protein
LQYIDIARNMARPVISFSGQIICNSGDVAFKDVHKFLLLLLSAYLANADPKGLFCKSMSEICGNSVFGEHFCSQRRPFAAAQGRLFRVLA